MTAPQKTSSPRPRSVALLLSLALLVGGLSILSVVVYLTMPRGGQLAASGSAIGGAFTLTDQNGRTVTNETLAGKPSLVFFGFTHCPDICPTKLFELTQMLDKLGADASKVNVAFVTVDPERDTPDLLKTYLGSFHPTILGLTGTEPQVQAAMRAYRAFARKVPQDGGNYTMDHTVFIYLMDRNGQFVSTFDLGKGPDEAAANLRRYL